MLRYGFMLVVLLKATQLVTTEKQALKLSDSYLPVAMQVIAHLTDQMSYESKDEATSEETTRPTTRPTRRPITRPTSSKPEYVFRYDSDFASGKKGWSLNYGLRRVTTQSHKPGLYAPPKPPKPSDRLNKEGLLPLLDTAEYSVLSPDTAKITEPLLAVQQEAFNPLVEPSPNPFQYLPPHVETEKVSGRSNLDLNEENLQYLSQDVQDMIRLAGNAADDKLIDVWDGSRAGPDSSSNKASLSASNLRLLLLYDLLSREAKKQKLSEYTGFSDALLNELVDSSSGGARAQLSFVLSKMIERHDCTHEYANNRAKEMVAELAKDFTTLSSELRYLNPLVYKF